GPGQEPAGGGGVMKFGGVRVNVVEEMGDVMILGAKTCVVALQPPFRVGAVIYQIYAQGTRALGLAAVAAAFSGMVLALQFGIGLGRFGAQTLLPPLTVLGLFRELVPVLVGLIIGSRLAAGIAAELGAMAVTEQIDAVRVLSADPVRELVAPRVVAAMIVLPLVTIFSDVVATGGAILIAAVRHGIGPRFFLTS